MKEVICLSRACVWVLAAGRISMCYKPFLIFNIVQQSCCRQLWKCQYVCDNEVCINLLYRSFGPDKLFGYRNSYHEINAIENKKVSVLEFFS